jgi:ATP-dependent RNA helicase RhlE
MCAPLWACADLAQKDKVLTISSFDTLALSEPLQRALQAEGHTTPTPIQAQAIPLLLDGRDLMGIAQTGTGKTAAFSLPLLEKLSQSGGHPVPKSPRALILAPTRELAVQIGASLKAYGRHLKLKHAVILGGVGQGPQVSALHRGIDILVATPGRLIDLMDQGHVKLDRVTFLVLDEADRMLDMGFIRDVRRIVGKLPKTRQSLLFSATMPADVAELAKEMLHQPERIDVSPKAVTVDRIDQRVYHVPASGKRALLAELLQSPDMDRVIVFTRTKRGADRVAGDLGKAGIVAEALHGNKSQNARQRALDTFRQGRARVLVATDIAARGIDVADVSHVVNYELPNEPESYVHRIGRTARAGTSGIAVSFCDASERDFLRDIERLTKRRLTVAGGEAPPEPAPRPQGPKHAEGAPRKRRRSRRPGGPGRANAPAGMEARA